MEAMKRRAGRPKAAPQTGPLVLEDDRRRVTIEIELPEGIADELKEYARWVELSSAVVTTADALSKTVQFGLRDVFRRDRMWQEHRRGSVRQEPAGGTAQAPASDARREATNTSAAPRPTPAPSPSPSLPPPSAATGSRANKNVEI